MEEGFLALLDKELVVALGCTEPISISFTAAKAREVLGNFPERAEIAASNNIIKNVKSVAVPNADGLKGVEAACVLGIVAGDADNGLEVLKNVKEKDVAKTRELLRDGFCRAEAMKSNATLHVTVKVFYKDEWCEVEVKDGHDNIVKITKNDKVLFEKPSLSSDETYDFSLNDVFNFVATVELNKVSKIIKRQLDLNVAIAKEGLCHDYGSRVGKTLLEHYPDSVDVRARAMAAAGSDARMNGCAMPVVINSGSGNQGITLSVPLYVFSKEYDVPEERLIRSVLLANLVSIYIKKGIGKLSAFCGAVSAGCGVAAGLTYLNGGTFAQAEEAISNTVADVAGIVCDGAKSSCAAKIASSVDAGIMAYYMAMRHDSFAGGDGIIEDDIEKTIGNVAVIGREGMKETDDEIIGIMLKNKVKI